MFRDREEAADRLAERLVHLRGRRPLVLAIPRGGVPMGRILADRLDGELDVVLVHKLSAPGNPEFAIGSVDERGHVELNPDARREDPAWVERERERRLDELRERRQRYGRPPADPAGRVVVIVDDGIATGATLLAAIHAVQARKPEHLVVAVGVAPPETADRIGQQADELVCLETPGWFMAVGQFFNNFRQVDDSEVIALLSAKTAQ